MEEVKELTEVVDEKKTTKLKTSTKRTRKPKTEKLEVKSDEIKEVKTEEKLEEKKVIVHVGETLYDVVPSESKTYILYTKGYNADDINFDKVFEMGAEVGSLILVKEWQVYFGKPSRYVPVALYMIKVGGVELIEPAKPVSEK